MRLTAQLSCTPAHAALAAVVAGAAHHEAVAVLQRCSRVSLCSGWIALGNWQQLAWCVVMPAHGANRATLA